MMFDLDMWGILMQIVTNPGHLRVKIPTTCMTQNPYSASNC
jgi:hypothetical protein